MATRKDASPNAQATQFEIDNDIPFALKLGNKTYKVPQLKDWTGNRIAYEIAKKNKDLTTDGDDISKVILAMKSGGNLPAKVLAFAILGSWVKIRLFHSAFWRYITLNFTKSEINAGLTQVVDRLELGFFFQNMILIEGMNHLRMKLTSMEAEQYRQELQSELKQTS